MNEPLESQVETVVEPTITHVYDPNLEILKSTFPTVAEFKSESPTRYSFKEKTMNHCACEKHIVIFREDQSLSRVCNCSISSYKHTKNEYVYETDHPDRAFLTYQSDKNRPIRIPRGYKYIALKANTGTGKTYQLEVLLKAICLGQFNEHHIQEEIEEIKHHRTALGNNPGVLFIGSRRTQDRDIKRRFRHFGAELGYDANTISEAPVWIFQWHSLWMFDKIAPRVIVIDEVELNRNCWTDELNLKYQHKNQQMFEFLLQNADLVLVMDANLSRDTIDSLSKLDRGSRWFVMENTFQPNANAEVRAHVSLESITNRCAEDLLSGKVLAVSSSSRKKLAEFKETVLTILPVSHKVISRTFDSKSPGNAEAFSRGLDIELKKDFTFLLYTSCMGVGVEYSLKEQVDKRYHLANYNEISAALDIQMLGRIRNPEDKTIELFIEKPTSKTELCTSREGIMHQISERKRGQEYIQRYYSPYLDVTTRKITFKASRPWVEHALVSNMIEKNKSKNNKQEELFAMLQGIGYKITGEISDRPPAVEGKSGCISHDLNPPMECDNSDAKEIETDINKLAYNDQVERNLKVWTDGDGINPLYRKYLRYRVEFPKAPPSMAACVAVEDNREQLQNIACMFKLKGQNELQNYYYHLRKGDEFPKQFWQLSAIRRLCADLIGERDPHKVINLKPPQILEGHVLQENMPNIINTLRKLASLMDPRIRSKSLAALMETNNSSNETITTTLSLKPIIGILNQIMNKVFLCKYELSNKRYKGPDQKRYNRWAWKSMQINEIKQKCTEVALESRLCDDFNHPGHPFLPIPLDEDFE